MDYYLLTGSNIGDSISTLKRAELAIAREIGQVIMASSYYKTAPWGFEAEQDFINQALMVNSDLEPETFLEKCLNIEKQMGRIRRTDTQGYQSRVIDIDVIFAEDIQMHSENLILPHPRMHVRKFVLKPLVDIAANFVHPTFGKTLNELLIQCPDSSETTVVQHWKKE